MDTHVFFFFFWDNGSVRGDTVCSETKLPLSAPIRGSLVIRDLSDRCYKILSLGDREWRAQAREHTHARTQANTLLLDYLIQHYFSFSAIRCVGLVHHTVS